MFILGVIARRLFASDWAGWLAALFAAGYAHLWINDEMLMSESMYVLTIAFAVWADVPLLGSAPGSHRGVDGHRHRARGVEPGRGDRAVPVPRGPVRVPRDPARREADRLEAAACKFSLAACVAGGLVMAPWILYNLTRFDHPVFLSNGAGSVLMAANCDRTIPAGQADAGSYVGTFHGKYVGYWSIYCTAGLQGELDEHYSPKKAAY